MRKSIFIFILFGYTHLGLGQENVDSLKSVISQLQEKVETLHYTELVQSMSQRSLLIPGYFQDLKALVAVQAYNFWEQNTHEKFVSHKNVYSALHYGNKYLTLDSATNLGYNQIKGHDAQVVSIEFGKGNVFYSAGSDGRILRWNLDNLDQPPTLVYEGIELYRSIEVSHDGEWLLACTRDYGIMLIDLKTVGALSDEVNKTGITFDEEPAQAAMFVPGELKYIVITKTGDVKMKGYKINETTAHTDEIVRVMAMDPKKKDVYAGTNRGVVQIWDEDFKDRYLEMPELYAVNALAISSDERYLAIGREKGDAVIWDMQEQKYVRTISGHQSAITDLDFSPDDQLLLSASRDKTVRIWDLHNPKKLPLVLDDHDGWVLTACFDESGKQVLSGSMDHLIRTWEVDPAVLAGKICSNLRRNMTPEEWEDYVGPGIAYQESCVSK